MVATLWKVQKGPGAAEYYRNLSKYYQPGSGGPPGPDDDFGMSPGSEGITTSNSISKWYGTGAQILGLSGRVEDDHLESLFAGFDPTSGAPLVQNAGSPNRQPCWDLVFSAPKSFSCLWARNLCTDGNVEANRLVDAQRNAVEQALAYAERNLAFSRVGKAGVNLEFVKVNLVVPTFLDFVNRSLEPQVHSHCPIINIGLREQDGKVLANTLDMNLVYTFKKVLGAIYRQSLARQLSQLGYEIEADGESWRITGFPQTVEKENSTRRKQILADLETKGVFDALEASKSAARTRPAKVEIGNWDEITDGWHESFDGLGFEQQDAVALKTNVPPVPHNLVSLARKSLQSLAESQAHFLYSDAFYACLVDAAPYATTRDDVELALAEIIDTELVFLGIEKGQPRYTTQKTLDTERELLDLVQLLKHRPGARASTNAVNAVLSRNRSTTPQQARAIRELTSGSSSIRLLDGIAGCGKTSFVLNQVAEAFTKTGYKCLALAPTGIASAQLGDDVQALHETPRTIASAFWKISIWNRSKHHLKELAKQAVAAPLPFRYFARRLPKANKLKLDAKTVLIIDEASMVDTKTYRDLAKKVVRQGGTIIFAFDWLQLPAVNGVSPTAFLRHEEKEILSSLDEIWRQNHDWQKQSVAAFKNLDVKTGLQILDANGCVSKSVDNDERMDSLLNDWTQFGIHSPQRSVVIADTNELVDELNERCQQARIEAGKINPKEFLTVRDTNPESDEITRARVHVSDPVYFTRNATKWLGIQNGTRGTVVRLDGTKLVVRLENKKSTLVTIPAREYQNIRLGYATTDYRTQGGSFESVYIVPGNSLHSIYVSVSRAVENVKLFVTNYEYEIQQDSEDSHLSRRLSRLADLRLASEFRLVKNPQPPPSESKPASLPLDSPFKGSKIRQLPKGTLPTPIQFTPAQTKESKSEIFLANLLKRNSTAPDLTEIPSPQATRFNSVNGGAKTSADSNPKQVHRLGEQPAITPPKAPTPVSNEKLPVVPKPEVSIPYSELTYEEARELGIPLMSLETRRTIVRSRHSSLNAQPVGEDYDGFRTPEKHTQINSLGCASGPDASPRSKSLPKKRSGRERLNAKVFKRTKIETSWADHIRKDQADFQDKLEKYEVQKAALTIANAQATPIEISLDDLKLKKTQPEVVAKTVAVKKALLAATLATAMAVKELGIFLKPHAKTIASNLAAASIWGSRKTWAGCTNYLFPTIEHCLTWVYENLNAAFEANKDKTIACAKLSLWFPHYVMSTAFLGFCVVTQATGRTLRDFCIETIPSMVHYVLSTAWDGLCLVTLATGRSLRHFCLATIPWMIWEFFSFLFNATIGLAMFAIKFPFVCIREFFGFWKDVITKVLEPPHDPFYDLSKEEKAEYVRGLLEANEGIRKRHEREAAAKYSPFCYEQSGTHVAPVQSLPSSNYVHSPLSSPTAQTPPISQPAAYSVNNPMSSYARLPSQLETPTPTFTPPSTSLVEIVRETETTTTSTRTKEYL